MNYSLHHAQSFKQDFTYLIGTSQCFTQPVSAHSSTLPTAVVKGIIIVGDDGACIAEQMQGEALQQALLDNSLLIRKPWLFKYRVYLIHGQPEDATTLYYRDLSETLDQLGIPFTSGKYQG